jgi:predicted dehydrogenase
MRITFTGKLADEREIRAGFIGCGSHSFRNLFPTFQFAPVKLVSTCDLDGEKAKAFAAKFGAEHSYSNHHEMLAKEDLDAIFICTGYDAAGRPLYPQLAVDCLKAGRHVWIEKPPAASCREIKQMQAVAAASGRNVLVGMKKMFFPANEKARELMMSPDFGTTSLALLQYPQYVPTVAEFQAYGEKRDVGRVRGFLDHLCHPASLMVFLLGMPETLHYGRSRNGSGVATFHFASGAMASIALTYGAAENGGMERTTIVSDTGRHIIVDNNIRVTYHRTPPYGGYGRSPNYFQGTTGETSAVWEPEFSLGQLYNKGLFLLGYYGEVNEFARSILEGRSVSKGTLEQAWQVTRIFEAFAEGPDKTISLQ